MPRRFARPWLVCTTPMPVISQSSELPGWEEKVPSLDRLAYLSGVFRDGTGPLDPAEVPDRVRLRQRSKRLPDGFKCHSGVLAVSDAVREVIEALDPGRHQFVPIGMEQKDGTPVPGPWWVLNVMHRQDSLLPELSHVVCSKTQFGPGTYVYISYDGIALDPARLDGSHLWRERQLRHGYQMFMSHALHQALKARGLRFLWQCRTRPVEGAAITTG